MVIAYLHDPLVHLASSLGLAALLGGAALHKLRDRQHFTQVLSNYRLLPTRLTGMLALALPLLELLAAVGLLLSTWQPLAAGLAAGLLALYAGVLAVSVRRGTPIDDCGCHFGSRRQAPSAALVWRNVLLTLLALNLTVPMLARPLNWFDVVTLGFALLAGASLYLLANVLIATRTSLREL
ncbi:MULTISPECIES: MauE/DoxX family redox-associated membrane protein [Pseudomonas]|uniref:Methylamine utilization protein MauE n=1 Tax=Pseudomonas fluorescens LMG 5329 TaxID=1324332 RepID=A0A0A1Z310_PSEFL|nr:MULTISPECIES: MauE/DoxX family redox-associated membrane protein [Pseudomonas]KGE67609.1 hypothetical protein K814_0112470 [Pseudomonas fluorescens LMG 5329]NWE04808.1 methylamine utilization protein MauE [Pseudomonas sp. IPO3749]NWF24557.1 methylamine utilization protein MauE [Pseudomonas sp. IPO3749]